MAGKKAFRVTLPSGENGQDMFNILWTAFCVSFMKQASGYEQLKLCNKIGDKLQSISEEIEGQETSLVMDRKLISRSLLLERMELDKLTSMLKGTDVPWTHMVGKLVETTVETLEASPEVAVQLTEAPALVE